MPDTTGLSLRAQGDQVKNIQANLSKVGVNVPLAEATAGTFDTGTEAAVRQFQVESKLPATGIVDPITETMLNNFATAAELNQSHVGGRLIMDYGLVAAGVTVRLYLIGFGGVGTKAAESTTDTNGIYSLPYTAPATGANIEIRVLDPQAKEVTVSSVTYNAPSELTLNLVAPASVQPLADEYQRLSADVQKVIGQGAMRLAAAQETDTQQDLTLINQSTGWDARLLALAATAEQQATPTGLGSDILYALFRTGLPTDIGALAAVPPAMVGSALAKASEAGIVTLSADQIAAAQPAFASFALKTNLEKKVAGAPSSFGELLGRVVTDPGQRAAFAAAFFDPTVSSTDLWNKAAAAGISPEQISALQQQGKLSFLTVNNADKTSGGTKDADLFRP